MDAFGADVHRQRVGHPEEQDRRQGKTNSFLKKLRRLKERLKIAIQRFCVLNHSSVLSKIGMKLQ